MYRNGSDSRFEMRLQPRTFTSRRENTNNNYEHSDNNREVTSNNCSYETIKSFLDRIDSRESFDFVSKEPDESEQIDFEKSLDGFLSRWEDDKKAVLGIDIFKYSQFDYKKQKLIPFVFSLLRKEAEKCFSYAESFFSYRYVNDRIQHDLIDTGDGGFLIFDEPIDAVVFLLHFNAFLHLYNSYHLYPKLRKYVGPLTIRYAITYDLLYKINSRFYGRAIINNARIISKDKLNRLLIDDKTYEWFLLNTNGIENLPYVKKTDLKHLNQNAQDEDRLFSVALGDIDDGNIRNVFCQKLEKIHVKDDDFDIYNLMIQSFLTFHGETENKRIPVVTTIGNMNCNGI
ncbi:hypothetical protein [Fibrobacter sp. UWB11]|uniref:hypothetical protein n=1 Tax=Fibrobacter sp. UWB11 TaxID=1896202 RepID=UPI00092C3A07|nr:hypothetical protein [Fibrobacter sp. UWB11]SIO29834.1 hypothetical protein SAMN05720758_2087 [Fibrobacter sp. UWB11]